MATHALQGGASPLILDPVVGARLETLAASAGRSVSELVGAVLREFLDENDRHLTAIGVGVAEADAGELIDFDEVEADLDRKLAALSARG
jgi:predicted transcriptional regulator